MAKHEMPETPDVSYIHNIGVAHEDSDMSLSGITKFVIHLILLVAISAALMWWLFNYLNKRETTIEERETRSTLLDRERPPADKPEQLFPEPRLQTVPVEDLQKYNAEIDHKLNYGWVDKEQGIVSISIEEAKKKLLASGQLMSKPAEETPATATTPETTAASTSQPSSQTIAETPATTASTTTPAAKKPKATKPAKPAKTEDEHKHDHD